MPEQFDAIVIGAGSELIPTLFADLEPLHVRVRRPPSPTGALRRRP